MPRATATIAPPFDGGQLAAQMGVTVYTSRPEGAAEVLVEAECDQATLDDALASYVHDPFWNDPEGGRLSAEYQTLRQWADDAEVLAADMETNQRSMTVSEQVAVVRRLGRLCDGLADFISRRGIV